MDVVTAINTFLWVGSNLLLAYVAAIIVIFVIGYYVLFDPTATTGGKMIFRFMLSLVGIIALIVFGVFVDPATDRAWMSYPEDVDVYRPFLRFAVYSYVAFTITSLAVLLVVRKWKPEWVKKASDLNLVKPRHTSEIPVIKED